MKKILTGLLILAIVAVLYATTTETHYSKTVDAQPSVVRKAVIASDSNDPFTETLDDIYGYLERVVIDATGTDIAYSVWIKDEYSVNLFAKTDCNTIDGDYSYAISASDTGGTEFLGVPVAGTCYVQVSGANDITSVDIIVYYRQEPQR